jgi:hypothetical protein
MKTKKKKVAAVKKMMALPKKRYGKTVMVSDPKKPGRKVGYASVSKTTLPKMKKRKVGKGASPQAKKSARKRK